MRFGTYFFFQAPPWLSDEQVIHQELERRDLIAGYVLPARTGGDH